MFGFGAFSLILISAILIFLNVGLAFNPGGVGGGFNGDGDLFLGGDGFLLPFGDGALFGFSFFSFNRCK